LNIEQLSTTKWQGPWERPRREVSETRGTSVGQRAKAIRSGTVVSRDSQPIGTSETRAGESGPNVGRRGGGETYHGIGNDVLGDIGSGFTQGEAATHGGVRSDKFGAMIVVRGWPADRVVGSENFGQIFFR